MSRHGAADTVIGARSDRLPASSTASTANAMV